MEEPPQQGEAGTILLVDDDKFLLDMYSTKFRESGKRVEVAFGGEAALQKLRGGLQPQAIVLDIVMPNVDGFELMKAIRDERLGDSPIIIALSNQGEESDISRAQELGAAGYIVKANSIPSDVLKQVEDIIHKHVA